MRQEIARGARGLVCAAALLAAGSRSAVAQSQGDWYYTNIGASQVRHLLMQVGGWTRPSCDSCADGATPRLNVKQPSLREMYVIEGVMRAWAAESFSSTGDKEMAIWNAQLVRFDTEIASALCQRPAAGEAGGHSGLERIWGCSPVPQLPFDSVFAPIPIAELYRRRSALAERAAPSRGVRSPEQEKVRQQVRNALDDADKSAGKEFYEDAATLVGQAVESLAQGWTGATASSQLPDLIREAREKLLIIKDQCALVQRLAKGRNTALPKCP